MYPTAEALFIYRLLGSFTIYESVSEYWQSILAITGMIVFMAISWKILSKEGIEEEDENETCPLEDYDLKKCPKCGGDSLRVSGDGSVECEDCSFSLKDAKRF